jgi:hypothetical protein
MNDSYFAKYFVAPKPLYTTQIFIPKIPATRAREHSDWRVVSSPKCASASGRVAISKSGCCLGGWGELRQGFQGQPDSADFQTRCRRNNPRRSRSSGFCEERSGLESGTAERDGEVVVGFVSSCNSVGTTRDQRHQGSRLRGSYCGWNPGPIGRPNHGGIPR